MILERWVFVAGCACFAAFACDAESRDERRRMDDGGAGGANTGGSRTGGASGSSGTTGGSFPCNPAIALCPPGVARPPTSFGESPCAPEDQGKTCDVLWEVSPYACVTSRRPAWCCNGVWQSWSECLADGGAPGTGGEPAGGEGGASSGGAPNGGAP